MINELYETKEAAFEAGKSVGRLDLDDWAKKRIAELEAALTPFVEAFEQFAKNEACSRVLSLGQLGRLAAGEVSGAHFKTACQVLTRQD